MAIVFDRDGNPIEVADERVDELYRAQRIRLPEQARYNVRDREGRVTSVDATELDRALGDGYSIASATQVEEQINADEYGNAPIQAGLEGAASGLTLGMSDALIAQGARDLALARGEGLDEAERAGQAIGERAERNQGARLTGEIAGAVIPALVSGGSSAGVQAAARGAQAARAVSGLARAGRVAGGALRMSPAGILARSAEAVGSRVGARTGSRALALAAEGAVEGAVQGAGQAFSDSALQDTELTAEALLMGAGTGVLFGGALGAGLGGASSALGAGVRRTLQGVPGQAAQAAQRVGRQTVEAVQGLYRRAAPPNARDLPSGVAELYAKVSSIATGADETTVRSMVGLSDAARATRRLIDNADQVVEQAARDGRDVLDRADSFARAVQDEAIGKFKRSTVRSSVSTSAAGQALSHADEMLSRIGAQADEMISDAQAWGERAAVARVRGDVDILKRRIASIFQDTPSRDSMADLFMEIDSFKRRIGKNARPGRYVNSSQDNAALGRIRDWYESTRRHLEVEDFYGGAASAQREINAGWVKYLDSSELYNQSFLRKVGQDEFNPRFTHDPAKLEAFLQAAGRTKNDLADEALAARIEGQRQLVEAIAKHTDLSPTAAKAVELGRATGDKLDEWLKRTREDVGKINAWRELEQASAKSGAIGGMGIGGALGAGIGAATLGPIGAGVGSAIGGAIGRAALRPDLTIKTMTALERIDRAMNSKISDAIRGMLGRAKDTAKGAQRATSDKLSGVAGRVKSAVESANRTAKNTAERAGRAGRRGAVAISIKEFDKRVEATRKAAASPTQTADRAAQLIEPLGGGAPRVAGALALRAQQSIGFLADRLPAGTVDPLQPHLSRPRVSDTEKSKWLRYARAVEDPMSVIDDIEAGTLNREGVEVLREIYPRIYQNLQIQVLDELAQLSEPLPYQNRLQLGILLEIPTDSSLRPEMIAALQAPFASRQDEASQTPAPAPQGTKAPDLAGAAPLHSDMDAFERRQAAG